MTRSNSALQHPEEMATVPFSSIDWMSLDDLIQSWADFGHTTTTPPACFAVSAAFAALAFESGAHQSSTQAGRERSWIRWSPRLDALLTETLSDLNTASQQWVKAQQWLGRATLLSDATSRTQITDLVVQVDKHRSFLFQLSQHLFAQMDTSADKQTCMLVEPLTELVKEGVQ